MSSELSVSVNGERRTVARGTCVREVLNGIPSKDLVAAKVNDKLVDLSRTLESDATVEPVLADSPVGLDVIRHSTAHLMAMAVQQLYPGTQVTIGPVIENGFYYDFGTDRAFSEEDLRRIEEKMSEIVGRDLPIHREEWDRDQAVKTFDQL